jgi:hypothetical protein
LTFQDARLRLLAYVRNEVRNGEITERGFARLIGISQPHAHNVLKGARTLSPQVFDLVLKYLHVSLFDLASMEEMEAQLQRRRSRQRVLEVAFLLAPIGPSQAWPDSVNWRNSFPLPFPSATVPAGLVMAKLVADRAMKLTLGSYDVALLNISERRASLSPYSLYVIERSGETLLRFIRSGARCHYLVTDVDFDNPAAWERIQLSSDAVKARVVWLGRERERNLQPQRGRFLDDPISS